jgi:SAM-dependent methyltransferase
MVLQVQFTTHHLSEPLERNAYNLPYRFYKNPPSVLVLGAGTGNDVAAAIRNNAGKVSAVEIDPLIQGLGKKLHFEKPYDSPRVKVVINDARSFVETTNEHFDLVVFSLLDSHTTSSYYSNIRIDNYVYTVEAIQATKRLLNPDGVMVIKFFVRNPWIAGRLNALLQDVFGQPPVEVQSTSSGYATPGRFYIAGSQEHIARVLAEPSFTDYLQTQKSFETSKSSSVKRCAQLRSDSADRKVTPPAARTEKTFGRSKVPQNGANGERTIDAGGERYMLIENVTSGRGPGGGIFDRSTGR